VQVIQPGNDCLEAPFLREVPTCSLIDDQSPPGARPTKRCRSRDRYGPPPEMGRAHLWAEKWCRIRSQCAIVQPKEIGCPPGKRDLWPSSSSAQESFPWCNLSLSLDNGTLRPGSCIPLFSQRCDAHLRWWNHIYPWSEHRLVGRAPGGVIVYELHVGTFTEEGSFEAVIPRPE